ncbi:MAG: VanZ family protein [Calditrichota bacterium]
MKNRNNQVIFWTILTVIYVIATFIISSIAEAGYLRHIKSIFGIRLDWFLHGVEYAIFSALFLRLGRVAQPKWSIVTLFILTVSLSFILGLLNELWQIHIPRRAFELSDLAANLTGTLIVLILYAGLAWLTTNSFRRKDVQRTE